MSRLCDPNPWVAPEPRPGPVRTSDAVVRLYEPGDGPALFAAVSASREALLPWMAWATTDHQTVDDSVHYVERTRRAASKSDCLDFAMGIFDPTDGSVLGGTGFHGIRPEFREAEVGYWIRGDLHRSGICTRAVGALISAAFTSSANGGWGFRRIVIFTAADNVGSRRVCEKLGLRLEARMRRERYLEPVGYHDTIVFGVLAEEWDFEAHRARPNIAWENGTADYSGNS